MLALLGKQSPIIVVQRTRQLANHLIIDPILADITQRLKHGTCFLASPDERLGGGIAELDHLPTDRLGTRRAIGHISRLGRHLGRKPAGAWIAPRSFLMMCCLISAVIMSHLLVGNLGEKISSYCTGSNTKFYDRFHVVWITKNCYKVLRREMRERLREIIRQTCAEVGVQIIKGVLSTDHVHMFVSNPPHLGSRP